MHASLFVLYNLLILCSATFANNYARKTGPTVSGNRNSTHQLMKTWRVSDANSTSTSHNSSHRVASPTGSTSRYISTTASIPLGECDCRHGSCNSTKSDNTRGRHHSDADKNYANQCVLWDDHCCGNITTAMNTFFNYTIFHLRQCLHPGKINLSNKVCGLREDRDRMAELETWMRSPKCLSTAVSWQSSHPTEVAQPFDNWDTCCGPCAATGRTVDIYYWPEPGADDSCLSIVEDSANPLAFGGTVTTDPYTTNWYMGVVSVKDPTLVTYWGCTPQSSGPKNSVITTAYLTTYDQLTFKVSKSNPWIPPGCVGPSDRYSIAESSNSARPLSNTSSLGSHTLRSQSPVTQFNTSLPVTAVSDGYTFTSPSVYARFHNVTLGDTCGFLVVTDTMLSFAPGEMSTVAAPLFYFQNGFRAVRVATRAFNPADLPCPPRSIAEEAWYKPQPQEPYRPLVALPEQLKTWRDFFTACRNLDFAAVDPPRALTAHDPMGPAMPVVAESDASPTRDALVPVSDGLTPPTFAPPAPGATMGQGPRQTDTLRESPSSPTKHHSPDDEKPGQQSTNSIPDPRTAGSEPQQASLPRPEDSSPEPHGKTFAVSNHEGKFQSDTTPQANPNDPNPDAPSAQNEIPGSDGSGEVSSNWPQGSAGAHGQRPDSESQSPGQKEPVEGGQPALPTKTLAIGPNKIQIQSNGIYVNNIPMGTGSSPVSLIGGSAAIIDKTGHNLLVGHDIYNIGPIALPPTNAQMGSTPLVTTLPNGVEAVLTYPSSGAGKDSASGNADGGQSNAPVLSIYGTSLIPGGAPVTIANPPGIEHGAPLTLSLDSDFHLIYNPTVFALPTFPPSQGLIPSAGPAQRPDQPMTTSIMGHQPLVILPNGGGVSIAGTTLYPTSLLASLAGIDGRRASMIISGTTVSLIGTSELVVGTTTVMLPTVNAAMSDMPTSSDAGNVSNSDTGRAQTSQELESFTGGATSLMFSIANRWLLFGLIVLFPSVLIIGIPKI